MISKPKRLGFNRLETDVELIVRLNAKIGKSWVRFMNESDDALCERYGITRKMIWDDNEEKRP